MPPSIDPSRRAPRSESAEAPRPGPRPSPHDDRPPRRQAAAAGADAHAAIAAVRARGLRVSSARRLVLEALFAADGPVTAEAHRRAASTAASRLRPRPRSTATSRRSRSSGSCATCTSATAPAGTRSPAPAARVPRVRALRRLRRRAAAALDGVRDAIRSAFGYEASFAHFPIVGLCPACAGADADDSWSGRAALAAS